MIHAFLFVTHDDRDRDGHGPRFKAHMYRINNSATTNITIYHEWHEESNYYKQHVWRCNGPCQSRSPFFGWLRRTANRKPAPSDRWWSAHSASCGGQFVKVSEPEKKRKRQKSSSEKDKNKRKLTDQSQTTLTGLVKFPSTSLSGRANHAAPTPTTGQKSNSTLSPTNGRFNHSTNFITKKPEKFVHTNLTSGRQYKMTDFFSSDESS